MTEKRILFLNDSPTLAELLWCDRARERAARYGFRVEIPEAEKPDWPRLLAEADGVITSWGSPVCTPELLAHAPRLRILGHAAGSVAAVTRAETYDLDLAILTANAMMAVTVAEWSLLMTLMAQRKLPLYAKLRAGERCRWENRHDFRDLGSTRIAVWGMGDITRAYLQRLRPLEPGGVIVYSRHADEAELAELGATRAAAFEELLENADILHCLAGMTPANCRRLGAPELARMKDGATVINAGRARLIDNEALFREVQSGRLNTILDVFEEEPLPEDFPFNDLPNAILTPHAAAASGRERYVPYLLDQFDRFFRGETPEGLVDKQRYFTMTDETCGK